MFLKCFTVILSLNAGTHTALHSPGFATVRTLDYLALTHGMQFLGDETGLEERCVWVGKADARQVLTFKALNKTLAKK